MHLPIERKRRRNKERNEERKKATAKVKLIYIHSVIDNEAEE
jgi:hypothetical protein